MTENQKLREALRETLLFCETFSNRWDGETGAHPFDMVERARQALATTEPEPFDEREAALADELNNRDVLDKMLTQCITERDQLRAQVERLQGGEPVAWRVRRHDAPKYWIVFLHKPVDALQDPDREVQPLYTPAAPSQEPYKDSTPHLSEKEALR